MKTLTKAEEEIMQVLWDLKKAFVREVIEELDNPKPAYNTVSTIIRILEQKEFVNYEAFGRSHRYFPIVSKEEYSKHVTKNLLSGYFSGSVENLLSFFVKENNIDVKGLDKILDNLKSKK